MIKETLTEGQFIDALKGDEYAGWSYGACKALYNYYEQLSDDIGEDIELDVVAIRCEWSEYDQDELMDYAGNGGFVADSAESQEENEAQALKYLENETTVLEAKTPNVDENGISYITSYVIQEF